MWNPCTKVQTFQRGWFALAVVIWSVAPTASPPPTLAAPLPPWMTNGPQNQDVLSLAIDPVTPRTLYAGVELGRMFKSVDGGMSWDTLNTTGILMGVNALVILPDTPTTIYAGTTTGMFVSTDAGASWNPSGLGATVVNALVLDPHAPFTLYAGVGGGGGVQGVFRSIAGGGQWTPITSNLPDAVVNVLALDPQTSGTLYAATDAGMFHTTNGGVSWSGINSGLPNASINAIALDPHAATTVYAGTDVGVYVSLNAGDTWQVADATFASSVSSIVIDPPSGTLYAGTFGDGVFGSTDGGVTWNDFNDGLSNPVVHTLALDAGPPLTVYAGTIDDGVFIARAAAQCLGDCDGSGDVTVNEIITMVNIALGTASVSACPAADPANTGTVTITQIIAAVNSALNGCPAAG